MSGRRLTRVVAFAAGLATLALGSWWWARPPVTQVDVVIIGDGAVVQARPEIERRLRQAGLVPLVVPSADDCAAAADHAATRAATRDAVLVISFATAQGWASCADQLADAAVQQPAGDSGGAGLARRWRPAAPLFHGAEREGCAWWDTPGGGEWKDGLGECESDGTVRVLVDDRLTPAGRERFARLVVAAVD